MLQNKRIKRLCISAITVVTSLMMLNGCGCSESKDDATKVLDVMKYDFGVKTDKVEEGWNGVTVGTKAGDGTKGYYYSKDKGFGFKDNGKEILGKSGKATEPATDVLPDNVVSDYALANKQEFLIDCENGYYTIQIVVGSVSNCTTTATIEGKETGAIGEKDKYVICTVENVQIEDGQINISFSGTGTIGGFVNAIAVTQVAAPTNLKAEVSFTNKSVALTWDSAKGADAYRIYRKDRLGAIVESTTKDAATQYEDTTCEVAEEYTYYVTGISDTGAESAPTNEVEAKMIDSACTVPAIPANVKIGELTENKTVVVWDAVADADGYAIYWSDRERPNSEGVTGYQLLEKTSATTVSLEASTYAARYYKVMAYNNGGFSDYSLVKAGSGMGFTVQLEYLDRGVVAVKTDAGVYVGWRLAADEYADEMSFELYRDGNKIADIDSETNTNYIDKDGTAAASYVVKGIKNGQIVNESAAVKPIEQEYYEVPISAPSAIALPSNASYSYIASDSSVGDVDGDGVYEIFVKWDPNNSQDNSKSGYTGPVYIDCYKLDGTRLWRINLGTNIRAGAHYTQFMVYDFDGDGIAEMMCKTADGTVDGLGTVIGDASIDNRNSSGYVLTGNEFLTLFDGATGKAVDTIDYNPARGTVGSWGDDYGNRVDRFLAGVAYLDGEKPSAIFARGYYTRAVVVAYDIVNKKIVERWVCDSKDDNNKNLAGQGAHCLCTGDVDMDGYDEITYGSATIDHDGTLKYTIGTANKGTSGGHGDAIHLGDYNLSNPGLEVFMVHETYPNDAGIEMHIGETGIYLISIKTNTDVGRGAVADIDPRYEGSECWATGTDAWDSPTGYLMSADNEWIAKSIPAANFTIWWDGDLGREILDHSFSSSVGAGIPIIYDWDYEKATSVELLKMSGTYTNNYTKGNPCLQADIFGDWREEVIVRTTDNTKLRIYTTTDVCDYRIYTLMHDVQYRCSVAWQNTAYNQPTDTSFYIGFDEDLIEVPVRAVNIVKK